MNIIWELYMKEMNMAKKIQRENYIQLQNQTNSANATQQYSINPEQLSNIGHLSSNSLGTHQGYNRSLSIDMFNSPSVLSNIISSSIVPQIVQNNMLTNFPGLISSSIPTSNVYSNSYIMSNSIQASNSDPNSNNPNCSTHPLINSNMGQNSAKRTATSMVSMPQKDSSGSSNKKKKFQDECAESVPSTSSSCKTTIQAKNHIESYDDDEEAEEDDELIVDVESLAASDHIFVSLKENDSAENEKNEENRSDPQNETKNRLDGKLAISTVANENSQKCDQAALPEMIHIKNEVIEFSEMDELLNAELIASESSKLVDGKQVKSSQLKKKNIAKNVKKIIKKNEKETAQNASEKLGTNECLELKKVCEWNECGKECADDNQLYDHIKMIHIGEADRNGQRNGDEFKCKWRNCDLSIRRGNMERKYNWLLNHILAQHSPRAETHQCVFVGCNLRFKKLLGLTNHLHTSHAESLKPKRRGRKRRLPANDTPNESNLLELQENKIPMMNDEEIALGQAKDGAKTYGLENEGE